MLPKRWIVERTLAWISRNRRLARDYERYARTVAAFIRLASQADAPAIDEVNFLLANPKSLDRLLGQ